MISVANAALRPWDVMSAALPQYMPWPQKLPTKGQPWRRLDFWWETGHHPDKIG